MTRARYTTAYVFAAVLATAGILLLRSPAPGLAAAAIPDDERAIVHALNRLAFGPRPGDVARIREIGLAAWIDRQLRPEGVQNATLDARLAGLVTLTLDAQTIAEDYVRPAREERQRRLRQSGGDPQNGPAPGAMAPMDARGPRSDVIRRGRQVFQELSEAKLLRAVYSERQLEEVLVDFWFNHFNVFARKGPTEVYVGEYEREGIRPHVLGTFRELVGATAKSPAMLFYLDNWMSADPNATASAVNLRRPRDMGMQPRGPRPNRPIGPASLPPVQTRRARGLNENYARELLELHTLGVDAGYTQQDVVDVARAFTGWTIGRPPDSSGFRFVMAMHDRGAKKMLGHSIPAGGGIEDGERVLDILARHPATARRIAYKLSERFVSDTPPPALVDRAARVFETTDGNLREVVRTIVTSPEFFAPAAHRAKVKTPFEFVASALRATAADVRSSAPVLRALAGLGMPLYLCQAPTGYDETAETWVSSGALVNRMNFALSLAGGQLRGIALTDFGRSSPGAAADRIIHDALAGEVSKGTLDTIARVKTVEQSLALAIGSPEFQRQ